ncbi:MAG: DUF87 domain-containing protein [Chloroflexi bacterium]|nr:DUF87 domain-containing protein [Chloroflexota bacterium]
MDEIGLVGSPSTTARVTVDIMEDAADFPLRGQLVSLIHQLDNSYLIALGTVMEIKTSNRWHEDPNMRGVLKHHGSLPHLSAVGDVRTADVAVQAVYIADHENPACGSPAKESGGALAMSPTTGARVRKITDQFLSNLLRRHESNIIRLGMAYGMEDVRLPLTLRHFGSAATGGAGEAYHIGIFGMTGSGKSGFAAYLLAAYARHTDLGILIIDPQGQFASEAGLPFSLQRCSKEMGREVKVLSVSQDLRLRKNAPLFIELLESTRFFKDLLSIRSKDPSESAVAELTRVVQSQENWPEKDAASLLRSVLEVLAGDDSAIERIYATIQHRKKLSAQIHSILDNEQVFRMARDQFEPLHSLFSSKNLSGGNRESMESVLHGLLNTDVQTRPVIIVDVSSKDVSGVADSDSPAAILETTRIKARLLREICGSIARVAESRFKENRTLNTMVVFDEAQRFAAESPEDDESISLADRLVDYVRTTRKFGLGWMFITQEINSLRRGIYSQLRVRSFGYGLTSGTELQRLRETIGDPEALDLYRSFVDPQAIRPSQYTFMITGPVSPLSFTGAPVFLSVYTDFAKFKSDNNL